MRTIVSHQVMFLMEEGSGEVVKTWDDRHARLYGVTVRLYDDDRDPRLHASGVRCRKDGLPDRRMGTTVVPVVLPSPDAWVSRARLAIRSQVAV